MIRCAIALVLLAVSADNDPLRDWPPAQRSTQEAFEAALNAVPSIASLRSTHDALSSVPHVAGTEGDALVIKTLSSTLEDLGLDVEVHEFWPLLAYPRAAELELITPDGTQTLPVTEMVLDEDEYTSHEGLWWGWNAYSGSGEAIGAVVYANFGTKDDFEKLAEIGIDVTGKIVIARYGGNFRGYKAKFAQEAGAAGLIIYTDPFDSGYRRGLTYPEGGWANETYIQRGSIKTLPYPGDPLTPFAEATEQAERSAVDEVDLPRIPVQPVGWGAAKQIMSRMTGKPVHAFGLEGWQGGLPFTYRLTGHPDLKVRLMVDQERRIARTANVIAEIRGALYPDEKIIIGCHHDAWSFGAGDPNSGSILVQEAARSFALAAEVGQRPARTVVFAHWGAEEYGIIGSTEWVEANRDALSDGGVAYINLDMATMGPDFSSSAAPALKQVIIEATRSVPQARDGSRTVHDAWAVEGKDEGRFGNLGGGSDHIGFYCHLGIPSCSVGAGGSKGVSYHSNYETLAWYRHVVGDDYEPALMLTRIVNTIAARLANAPVLPIDPVRYAPDARKHLAAITKRGEEIDIAIDLATLQSAITAYEASATTTSERLASAVRADSLSDDQLMRASSILRTLERAWLTTDGLRKRPWYRNLYAASDPDSGYAAWMLPNLRLAVERRDPAAIRAAAAEIEIVFGELSRRVGAIESILDEVRP